jgi:protein-S-isoprenylcysteine O-methyltransferase Ste14
VVDAGQAVLKAYSMFTIYLTLLGLFFFVAGVVILGAWLRKNRTKENAEKSSRIMHFLFFAGMVTPPTIGIFYPGLTHFDELAGLKSLPWMPLFLIIGIIMAIPGLYFLAITNKLLRALGNGANAFRLTKQIVADDIYKRTRNPMSLGFYLFALALGFASNSTFILLAVSLGLIPAHIFFLKYFEELELELRFGESYLEYKKTVPFLIPRFK